MKGKHLVYKSSVDGSNPTWFCGHSTGVRGISGPFTDVKEDATWLTKKQAKDLIDSMRHRQHDVHAEPSFTVVY